MSFLDLNFLWLIPLVLLPIIIHLLNRMRYQTKSWAALEFLMNSKKRSKVISRLKHILILLSRILMLLFLIFALARPIVGGWLGGVFAGSPENVIIIFDRSASMSAIPKESELTNQEKQIKLLTQLGKQYKESRFVLLDSANGEIKALKDLSYLSNKKLFSATETYTALPKLISKAIDFYKTNDFGKTQVWVVSDYQKSNWNINSPRWKELVKAKEDDKLKFRLFLTGAKSEDNVAIRLQKVLVANENDKYVLYLNCEILQNKKTLKSLILTFNINGTESKLPLTLQGNRLEFKHKIEVLKEFYESGYGYVELPFDSQINDNRYYFTYAKKKPFNVAIISNNEERGKLIKILTAPYVNNPNYNSQVYNDFARINKKLDDLTLLILDGVDILEQYEKTILSYIQRGGYILLMPPFNKKKILNVLAINKIQEFEENGIRVTYWEKNFGPFAKSSFGKALPLDSLKINRRQVAEGGLSLAEYEDGSAFISRYFYGLGSIYYCSTSVDYNWSNLDQGVVLLPMLHRMMAKANERFSNVKNDFLGQNILSLKLDPVLRHNSNSKFLYNSGVFKDKKYTYAFNRPPLEDDFDKISQKEIDVLFRDLSVDFQKEKADEEVKEITSLWTFFISLILIMMFIEALVTLGQKEIKKKENI